MNILVTKTTNVSPPDQQRCCRGELNMRWWLTNASSKVWVQLISEKRLRQLTEIQLQCSSDGVYVYLPHHESHVLVVCKTNETSVSIYQGIQELWGKKNTEQDGSRFLRTLFLHLSSSLKWTHLNQRQPSAPECQLRHQILCKSQLRPCPVAQSPLHTGGQWAGPWSVLAY